MTTQENPRFIDFGPGMPLELGKKQNIVNQPPFNEMAGTIALPGNFFVGKDHMAGLGAFMRCVVLEPHHWANVWNTPPLTHLAPHINLTYHNKTSLELIHQSAVRFIDSFPYLMQYLREYWKTGGAQYDVWGYPLPLNPSTKIVMPRFTFAAYQSEKRGDPWFGLEDESPGLETAESLQKRLATMRQQGANKRFRVLKSISGNQG